MNISENGLELIKDFEGCKLTAYQDSVGVWTIGYGHTLNVKLGDIITDRTATVLLIEDLRSVELTLNMQVEPELSQNQYDALCSFIFNLGTHAFHGSTLLKKLNRADFVAAADEILKWDKAGGVPLTGLTRRREAERTLFLKEKSE